MMRVPNGSLARTKPRREHGRHIFAYCNIKTNQVLYSLTQALNGASSLKQLPDAGANNNPPKLRKDLWRPLWSVTLPDGENGLVQGLDAFQKLKEYKKLHELSWEAPPELTRHTNQEEMDKIQEYLDERGGKKTETVHDIIKRRKKKIRQRMVMDQKANSIADLAAVLIHQDETGARREERQEVIRSEDREGGVGEMLTLARKTNEGELEKLEGKRAKLAAKKQAKKEGRAEDEQSNRSITQSIRELDWRIHRMRLAQRAVGAANEGLTLLHTRENDARSSERQMRLTIRKLKTEIEALREGEETAGTDAASSQIVASPPFSDEVGSAGDLSRPTEYNDILLKYTTREVALELEMIRQLHERTERVERALNAYKPRQTDIARLQDLSRAWTAMVGHIGQSYHDRVDNLRSLQTALDGGEAEFEKYAASHPELRRTEDGTADYAYYDELSSSHASSIEQLEKQAAFLDDISQMMGEVSSVQDAVSKTGQHRAANPDVPSEIQVTRQTYGRIGSKLRRLGPPRAYATVVAKAKIDARATQLAEEMKNGAVTEAASEEADKVEAEQFEVLDEGEDIEEDADPPEFAELSVAVKEYQHLNTRVWDLDHIDMYETALAQLSDGADLEMDLKPQWQNLELENKRKTYESYVASLRQQSQFLGQARNICNSFDGEAKLLEMANDAKQRSKKAQRAKDNVTALEQRHAAEIFSLLPRMRELEDVIVRAPDSTFEGIDENPEAVPGESKPIEEKRETSPEERGLGTSAEAQRPGKGQEMEPNTNAEKDPNAAAESPPSSQVDSLVPGDVNQKGLRSRISQLRKPIFTTAGITVKWNNILDAEYAEQWPQNVKHERMGLTRHTAPKADAEPVYDVAEWKNRVGGGYKGKRFEWQMQRKAVRERVKGVTGRVIDAVVKREAEEEAKRLREARQRRQEASAGGGGQAKEPPMET